MRRVQLDAVQAGFPRSPRTFGKMPDRLFYLGKRHRFAQQPVKRIHAAGRREAFLAEVFNSRIVTLPPGVTQLQDELAIVPVHRVADRPPERNLVVAVDHGVIRKYPAPNVHRDKGRNNRADTSACKRFFPIDTCLRARSVVVIESAGNVGSEQPVFDGQVPKS